MGPLKDYAAEIKSTNQNMKLTNNQLNPIQRIQIAAFFNAAFHDLNFASSPAAVTIWNQP